MSLGAATVSDGIYQLTPSGTLDSRYRDGDDGTPTASVLSAVPTAFDTIEITLVIPPKGLGPFYYELDYTVDPGPLGTWLSVDEGTDLFDNPAKGDPYVHTGLSELETYYYRIRARLASGTLFGSWSDPVSATTPEEVTPEPSVPGKITGVTIGSVTSTTFEDITWNADPDATSYRFFVGFGNGSGEIIPGEIYIDTTTVLTSKASVTGLASEQEYYVQVYGLNSVGQGEGSDPLFFTTDPLPEEEPADFFVRLDGEDGAFTTIQAAVNAAQAGQRIEVRANTPGGTAVFPGTGAVSKRAGTEGNPIVLYGRPGDTIIITGYTATAGVKANVHMLHDWLDWGENLTVQGDLATIDGGASAVERGVHINCQNFINQFNTQEHRISTFWVVGQSKGRCTGGYTSWNGTIDSGDPKYRDGGDGATFDVSTAGLTLDHCLLYAGGHSLASTSNGAGNLLYAYDHLDSLWDKVFNWNHPEGSAEAEEGGNRVMTLAASGSGGETPGTRDIILARCVMGPAGNSWEANAPPPAPRTQAIGPIWRNGLPEFVCREVLTVGVPTKFGAAYGVVANNTFSHPVNHYHYNGVIANINGPAISYKSNRTIDTDFGPFYYKNYILFNCNNDPVGTANAYIAIEYRSTEMGGDGWEERFFFDTIIVPSLSVPVFIRDLDGVDPTINDTIGNMADNFEANFANIIEANPNFVDSTTPRVPFKTPWNDADWDTIRENWTPQAAAALTTGTHLTRVNGAVSGSTSVTVDDAGWIGVTSTGGGYLAGDPIFDFYIEGFGVVQFSSKTGNVLTADQAVTCADNARIWPGSSSTPNIGWVL